MSRYRPLKGKQMGKKSKIDFSCGAGDYFFIDSGSIYWFFEKPILSRFSAHETEPESIKNDFQHHN